LENLTTIGDNVLIIPYWISPFQIVPQGTVTYHRQVIKKPVYLATDERWKRDDFRLSDVTVDWSKPLEEAPQGALQLDFANKNIGGGALEKVITPSIT